ncbi:hypothetical protein BDF14DRAFT_1996689 [Spinellus fusiger]|nr:hypothetical protein BDF14DRAFT_1996689 [Spinellus fusiger]
MQFETLSTAFPTYCADSMSTCQPYSYMRYPLPTPPPSASPIELAPILDMCDSMPERPPSPTSPLLKREECVYSFSPPPFLEPVPQFSGHGSFVFPLFEATRKTVHASHSRHSSQQPYVTHSNPAIGAEGKHLPSSRSCQTLSSTQSNGPISPTMAAAAATAASSSVNQRTGSLVAETLVNALRLTQQNKDTLSTEGSTRAYTQVSFMVHGAPVTMDQSMFLTKNAHIKRPRNAWIHFRCHYGQALKSQDPTLRAEEISKRASRRWAKLTEREKKPWHDLAEEEKQAHKEAFPEYRYSPKRDHTPSTPDDPDTDSARQKRTRRAK